jgi:hypothetical protein
VRDWKEGGTKEQEKERTEKRALILLLLFAAALFPNDLCPAVTFLGF